MITTQLRDGVDRRTANTSGNRAFDDYRAETLRRLEDEQREFKEFLKRLRVARDRAEFDQFMNDRHNRPADHHLDARPPVDLVLSIANTE
jgi:hypothetical protein